MPAKARKRGGRCVLISLALHSSTGVGLSSVEGLFGRVLYRTMPYRTVMYRTAPYQTEPHSTVPHRTVPNRTEPSRTGTNRAEPYHTKPNRTVPNRTVPHASFVIPYRTVWYLYSMIPGTLNTKRNLCMLPGKLSLYCCIMI